MDIHLDLLLYINFGNFNLYKITVPIAGYIKNNVYYCVIIKNIEFYFLFYGVLFWRKE